MAVPIVRVEQIAFRFPGASRAVPLAHQDRVAIRRPEWKRGVRSEPAAYARPASRRPIKIKAVFSCSDPAIRSVRVRARRTGASGFFGDIGEVAVRFTRGRSKAVACRVSCSTFRGVALESVSWQWQYKIGARWIPSDRSGHKLALVLAEVHHEYREVDLDLLLTGVVLHDIGKIHELTYERSFSYSTEGQLPAGGDGHGT